MISPLTVPPPPTRSLKYGTAFDAASGPFIESSETLRRVVNLRSENGLTLIEVIVSALLVGFIAIATFSGFNTIDHTTADERLHSQAAVLVAQAQEQLRSDSAGTLDALEAAPHSYTQTIGGQKFTITQYGEWVNESNQAATCNATSKEANANQKGKYLRITSAVRWPQLQSNRPAVKQTSLITPPDGSGLEVDVTNGGTPLLAVGGASAIANDIELTTNEAGCATFGAIPATTAEVEVKKIGSVMENGSFRKVSEELPIVPNITTHYPVTLAPAGRIEASFTYEGSVVPGDTFVASNNNIKEVPNYELGSTAFSAEVEKTGLKAGAFHALAGTYATTAKTFENKEFYPNGDLFPFTTAWNVYAGDCPANEPGKFGATSASAVVTSNGLAKVSVPMFYDKLELYKSSTQIETSSLPVKITNLSCASYTPPNNSTGALALERTENTNASGQLPDPYQPYGKFKFCAYSSSKRTGYYIEVTNEGTAPKTIKLVLNSTESKTTTSC